MSERFLAEVRNIEEDIASLDGHVKAIDQLQRRAVQAVSQQEEKRVSNRVAEISREANASASNIRNRMHGLKDRINPQASDYQIRKNHIDNLARKFMQALQRFQEVQMNHQHKQQEKIRRQYLIANPDATEEELRNAMNADDASPVFSQRLMMSQRGAEARRVYQDVEDRHQQVVKLAKSIEQLHALFMDMQTMVETQDQLVISIGDTVDKTERATEQAATEMREAVVQKKASRKKCMMLICCLIILLIVLVLVILLVPMFGEKPLIFSIAKSGEPAPAPSSASRLITGSDQQ